MCVHNMLPLTPTNTTHLACHVGFRHGTNHICPLISNRNQTNLHNILPLISNNTRNPSCKTDLVAMTNWPCQVAPHYQVAPYYR